MACKKWILCGLLCCALPLVALAENDIYYLDEPGLTIELGGDFMAFTRGVQEDDPNLTKIGLSREEFLSLMREQNAYLVAWDESLDKELLVSVVEVPANDLNQFSDTQTGFLLAIIKGIYENAGIDFLQSDTYSTKQAKFARVQFAGDDGIEAFYGLQYVTIRDGKLINIALRSYDGPLRASQKGFLQRIVDRVVFDAPLKPEPEPVRTPAFLFTDPTSGIAFTVPANWQEEPMTEEREYLDAKFVSTLDAGLSMFYSCADLWSELSEAEKSLLPRALCDSSAFTGAEIARILGYAEDEFSVVSIAGDQYYSVQTVLLETFYGIPVEVPATMMARIENGYLFLFQFAGATDNAHYNDFRALMNSVDFSGVHGNETLEEDLTRLYWIEILFALVVTIAIYSLPILLYRYVIRRRPMGRRKAKRVAIVYGAVAFVAMSCLIAYINGGSAAIGAVFLWSWVNYKTLTSGKKRGQSRARSTRVKVRPQGAQAREAFGNSARSAPAQKTHAGGTSVARKTPPFREAIVVFCHKCGNRLAPGSAFCNRCGAQVIGTVPRQDRQ